MTTEFLKRSYAELYVERDHPSLQSRNVNQSDTILNPLLTLPNQVDRIPAKVGKLTWTILLFVGFSLSSVIFISYFIHSYSISDAYLTEQCFDSYDFLYFSNIMQLLAAFFSVTSALLALFMTVFYSWTWGTTFYAKMTPLLPFAHDIEDLKPYELEKQGLQMELEAEKLVNQVSLTVLKSELATSSSSS